MRYRTSLEVILFCSLLLPLGSHASVPYSVLETLRQQTVVTRVIVDNPEAHPLKHCESAKRWSELGQALALAHENLNVEWNKTVLESSDLPELKTRISKCLTRASCQIYSVFLDKIKIPESLSQEVQSLREMADRLTLETTALHYRKALSSVADPCLILKTLL